MRRGQQLIRGELTALPIGSRVADYAGDIAVKQADGKFKFEGMDFIVDALTLDAAYGPVRFYDVPDLEEYPYTGAVVLVFDGPPGHQSGRFIEAEDAHGRSINAGEWRTRGDGTWELRLSCPPAPEDLTPPAWVRQGSIREKARRAARSEWDRRRSLALSDTPTRHADAISDAVVDALFPSPAEDQHLTDGQVEALFPMAPPLSASKHASLREP